MSQDYLSLKLTKFARDVVYIHGQVGYDRFRLASGEIVSGNPDIPRAELPDWSNINPTNGIQSSLGVKNCAKIQVRKPGQTNTHAIRTYRLRREAVEAAQSMLNNVESFLPCGHRGLSNPRGVDGYQCAWDGCDAVFDREEVQR